MKYHPCDICNGYEQWNEEDDECVSYKQGYCQAPHYVYLEKAETSPIQYVKDNMWVVKEWTEGMVYKKWDPYVYEDVKKEEVPVVKEKPKKKTTPSLTGEFPRKISW